MNTYILLVILAMFIATYITRALPFFILSGQEDSPNIKFFGKYLPPAVMLLLVIYCLKDLNIHIFPYGIPEAIAVIVVIFIHIWKRNALLSILLGTTTYVIMSRLDLFTM
jgi:Predicted branched-chain amino acid permeases (azaleucine resistance)